MMLHVHDDAIETRVGRGESAKIADMTLLCVCMGIGHPCQWWCFRVFCMVAQYNQIVTRVGFGRVITS